MGLSAGLPGRMPIRGGVSARTLPLDTDVIYGQSSRTPSTSLDVLDSPKAFKSLTLIGVPRLIGLIPFIGVFGIPVPVFPESFEDILIPLPSMSSSS